MEQPVLRVLSGRSQGAEHRLPAQRKLAVGHSFENDIVLRDRSTKGGAFELLTGQRRPLLRVVAGSVRILGRELGAGEETQLEPYLPVTFGDIQFAIGGDDEARWAEALAVAVEEEDVGAVQAVEECQPIDLVEKLELRTQPALERVSRFNVAPKILAVVGAIMLALAAGSHFGAGLTDQFEPSAAEIDSELRQAGFPNLRVERASDGQNFAVTGLVRDEQTLSNLRSWMSENHSDVLLDVETIHNAAASATDLLAAQNIDAEARPDGVDGLVIDGPFLPKDRQRELTELLRQDLPQVGAIAFQASGERGESDLAYFFNSPGYGAASFVSGDPGYLVTEDGTRWFPGAALPTGHRIVEIAGNSITVERDGLRDTLVM